MSKYALKLEQLVQTDNYGDILVTIQYDGQGPKLVIANGEKLFGELKHTLDTVLGLVNFMLAKEITPAEIADQLEAEPKDGLEVPLNNVLMVVAASLKEAPEGVNKISPDILMTVPLEMIREFTENASAHTLMEEGPVSTEPEMEDDESKEDSSTDEEDSKSDDDEDSKPGFFGGFNRRN